MKRFLSVLLILCLAVGTIPSLYARAAEEDAALRTIRAAGIMIGDNNGNMNLTSAVTRAEFSKMMAAASIYKNNISQSLSSFSDVGSSHWAAGYIKTAVNAGWFAGYADGTFRPSNNIKLEEAATALLRMLGYTDSADFGGAYPQPQLARYRSAGLSDGLSLAQGGTVTRADCVKLFYNLLHAKTKEGAVYATTIGMTLDASGKVDYNSLILADLKGPFVAEGSWFATLPFGTANAAFYLNGNEAAVSSMNDYDVFYYNENLRTVWIYRNSITGVYSSATPSTAMPSSVVVSGVSYTLATSAAAHAMSDAGAFSLGDTVTLLLGMDGGVAAAVDSAAMDSTLIGVVTAAGTATYTDGYGGSWSEKTATFTATNGSTYTYPTKGTFKAGDLISVQISKGNISVRSPGARFISGQVNAAGTAAGQLKFAEDARILDSVDANVVTILPPRLSGMNLSSANVRYYATDSNGDICDLILKDATGDVDSYGVITAVNETSEGMVSAGSYAYLIGSTQGSFYSTNTAYNVKVGPAAFRFAGTVISGMRNLNETALTHISGVSAKNGATEYGMADNAAVYIKRDGGYYPSNINTVSDTDVYSLKGYYDKAYSDGGRIRVIIATAK